MKTGCCKLTRSRNLRTCVSIRLRFHSACNSLPTVACSHSLNIYFRLTPVDDSLETCEDIFHFLNSNRGDENRSEGSVGHNQSGASDLTISPSCGPSWRELTRENIFYFNWHHSNNYKPLINWGPDTKLTCNLPGLGSKL